MEALRKADVRTHMQIALRASKKLRDSPVAERRLRPILSNFGVEPPKDAAPEVLIGALLRLMRDLDPHRPE